MRVIRFNLLSAAQAEQVVAKMWCILEKHQIASPDVTVKPHPDDLMDLQFAFTAEQDADIVEPQLRRLRPGGALALVAPSRDRPSAIETMASGDGSQARIVAVD